MTLAVVRNIGSPAGLRTNEDVAAFEQMFRPSGVLQRWTTRPSLVVLGSVMTYQVTARDEYSATSSRLSDAEVAELIDHLTEGLAILTAGTYTAFASVDVEYPAANARIDGSDIVYQNFFNIGVALINANRPEDATRTPGTSIRGRSVGRALPSSRQAPIAAG